ncbi:MAG: DNA primase [Terriglobia bacterium]
MNLNNEIVDQVKRAADIVQVVQGYVRLKKSGANYLGLCPFHSEKTPSFHVRQNPPYYYCFGCQAKGDVLSFVQTIERLTFPEALKMLAEKFGVPMPRPDVSGATDDAAQEKTMLLDLHEKAAKFFGEQLRHGADGKQALAYLTQRGLHEETMDRFLLGYSGVSSNAILRKFGHAFSQKSLLSSGLIQESESSNRPFDRFRRRIMFPIRNESGKVIAFGGRILGEGQPKYLNSPETPIYSKSRTLYAIDQAREPIRRKGFVVLVEGYMDCIALQQAGIQNVVASCGTSLTEQQAKLLLRYTDRVVVNFDPDTAGTAAAVRSLGIFVENGFHIRVLNLPDGDDPDSFVRTKGAEAYGRLLEGAPHYIDFLIQRSSREHDVRAVEGKIAALNQVLPFISLISNRIERIEQAKHVAEIFNIDESVIREELKKGIRSKNSPVSIDSKSFGPKLSKSEKNLLNAVLGSQTVAKEIIQELSATQNHIGLQSEGIFQEAIALFTEEGKIDLNRLQERLRNERDLILLNQALFNELDTDQSLESLEGIRRQRMRQQIDELQKKIRQAELSQDFDLLAKLHSEKLALKRQIAS